MFWKKKALPPPPALRYSTTSLQVGDECICIGDSPHTTTHQKLLEKGQRYVVRYISVDSKDNGTGYGGPFIKVEGIFPIADNPWDCHRFQKVSKTEKKSSIEDWVKEPTGLDIEKEKEGAY